MKRALVYLVLLFLPVYAAAYQVELVAPVSECTEGESIVIEIHVFPAKPAHTTMSVESVPRGFSLVSSRKERRRRVDPSSFDSGRVDSVVFFQEWAAGEAGRGVLGPFIVMVDGVEQVLAPLDVQVHLRHDTGRGELRWEVVEDLHEIYQETAVTLVLEGRYLHEIFDLKCPLPRNALLEQSDSGLLQTEVSGAEWKPVARFSWTPLSAGSQTLPFARIAYRTDDGQDVTVGSARQTLSVRPAVSASSGDAVSPLLSDAFAELPRQEDVPGDSSRTVPVPESLEKTADPAVMPALTAWQIGRYGEAVATLRRMEHESLFPGHYRHLRQDAERALGFAEYPPPPSRILVRIVLILSSVLLLTVVLLFFLRKKARILSWCFTIALSFLLVTVIAGFFVLPAAFQPQATSTGGVLRQIPEDNAGIVSSIPAGTPVVVLKKTGSWYYVRFPVMGSGWVPEEQIIPYTSAGFYGFW